MASEAAKLLDELMGRDRNAVPGEDSRELHWSDREVRSFAVVCGGPHTAH